MINKFWWLFELCTMSGVDKDGIKDLKKNIKKLESPESVNF